MGSGHPTRPENPRALGSLGRWFWQYMGQVAGRLRPDAPETVWLVTTPLDDGAREYVTRFASFWCDEVYWEYPVARQSLAGAGRRPRPPGPTGRSGRP